MTPRKFLKNIHPFLLFSTGLALLLTSCQLLKPYQAPLTPTPYSWKTNYDAPDAGQPIAADFEEKKQDSSIDSQAETEQKEPCFKEVCRELDNWWEIFQEPILNQLEEQALNSSYSLWAALERVIQARDVARIDFAPLLPAINFNPSYLRNSSLTENPLIGLSNSSSSANQYYQTAGQAPSPTQLLSSIPKDFRFLQTQYLVPFNLSYEIDLWKQLSNAYYASLMRAQSASQAYLSVLLSLTTDIASTYFQIRALDTQQAVIQKNIKVRQKAVDINKSRFEAGLIVYLDVSRAEVELARAYSDADNVGRLRGLQENILATLVGTPASIFSIQENTILIPPPVLPTGMPSELLCRRPDIGEAERLLAAAYRDIGVAYANFFPSLNLNAAYGVSSPFTSQLFSWHARFWELGLNVMQTVFDAGRNQANYEYSKSRFREAMANYQQKVLQAFQDVEDSLVNLNEYSKQAGHLAEAVKAAQLTLELAQTRYMRGLINYLDVVDAERQLLETEQNSVIVLGNRYISTVILIKALGGGWDPCPVDWETKQINCDK